MAVRMSAEEWALVSGEKLPPRKEAAPRKDKRSLPENQVEAQILDFLRLRRWGVTRQHVGKHVPLGYLMRLAAQGRLTTEQIFRGVVTIGEEFAADWRAERPADIPGIGGAMIVLYIEIKAKGQKPSAGQLAYLDRKRLTGALAGWWDSLDSFQEWYLARFR